MHVAHHVSNTLKEPYRYEHQVEGRQRPHLQPQKHKVRVGHTSNVAHVAGIARTVKRTTLYHCRKGDGSVEGSGGDQHQEVVKGEPFADEVDTGQWQEPQSGWPASMCVPPSIHEGWHIELCSGEVEAGPVRRRGATLPSRLRRQRRPRKRRALL
eukprot:scaffold98767_cov32-Tisochrysis_lutea.AAC.4